MSVSVGQRISASEINNLSFFPVGMVLAIQGTVSTATGGVTVNGQTLSGWYVCNGSNGTPNMQDRFICGTDSTCGTAGAASVSLTSAHLPAHTHTVTTGTPGSSGSHYHNLPASYMDNGDFTGRTGRTTDAPGSARCYDAGEGWWYINRTISLNAVALPTHGHTISGKGADRGTATCSLTLRPNYYKLIFIRKCT